jgi:hypothetical protein
VRTFSKHNGLSHFPYEPLYVVLLIGQAVALLAWVAYGPI